nr:MAG TPA: hypothetical protein [Caudoviricetes sp.]
MFISQSDSNLLTDTPLQAASFFISSAVLCGLFTKSPHCICISCYF